MELIGTLNFLTTLKKNNYKEWFDENRKIYQSLRVNFLELVQSIIEDISEFDENLSGVESKKCVFRINRDIRFSKDKTPYKSNFGALMGDKGRKSKGTSYYIHIEPGNSFIGGGVYMPSPDRLAAIRQEIDYNAVDLKKIINTKEFNDTFGEIKGEALKTTPKGYSKDHTDIELLRLKSFYVIKYFDDKLLKSNDFYKELISTYKKVKKFNKFLNHALS